MIFLIVPLIVIFWWLGTQINKLFKPIGVTLSLALVYLIWHNHPWWCILPSFLYGFELTLGYGENSKLIKWLKDDELVRDVFSLLCCIPVIFTVVLTENWEALGGLLLILGAFQVRKGKIGQIGKYDIILDDLLRGLSIGLAMALALK